MAVATVLSTSAATDKPASSRLVRVDGRDADLVAFDEAIVSFFVEAADSLSVPRSVAAIYGVCFASPEPLTFADIEARLDISKGSVSQGLRVLRDMGAIKSAGKPDERGEAFEADMGLRKLAAHWLEERLQRLLDAGRCRLQEITNSIPMRRSASARELRGRLKLLRNWQDKSRTLLPLVKTFLKLT
jgi:DNA-binding transcriptional regulator GbsR (MarR family)